MAQKSNLQLPELCEQVTTIVEETGDFIRHQLGKVGEAEAESKALNSLVSYVDRQAETQLVTKLRALLPDAGFLTEEETVAQSNEARYRWIIDPLDGTTNFLFQLPCFAVSVALEAEGELVLGVVLEVNREECFYAWQGGGAWLNGERIRCRQNQELSSSLIATGFPYHELSFASDYFRLLAHLKRHTRGIRRWGAAAVDLAFTAAGRFDGYYEAGINAWDVAAGIVLVREAGGTVTDFHGHPDCWNSRRIVAGSAAIQPLLLSHVREYLSV